MPYYGGDPYNHKEYLKMERVYREAETKAIFNSAVSAFTEHLISVHPSFKRCPIEGRQWQVWTKCFYPELMWELIGEVQVITCVCNDGVERTYEIRMIEPFCNEPKTQKCIGGWGLKFYF
jgi:hypothetical protein